MSSFVTEKGGLGFEETELRLGLPGGGGGGGGNKDGGDGAKSCGKRGFEDTIDLKLKLNTNCGIDVLKKDEAVEVVKEKMKKPAVSSMVDPEKPPASKAQVVGWPPVRSFRKNVMSVQSTKAGKEGNDDKSGQTLSAMAAAFVKVSKDGAPYLRKVDLKMYKTYKELSAALEKMFSSFTIGNCGSQGINFMDESKLMDLLDESEYVSTYEDKDGDWMLVGDVPWEMFVESCKRMRIMKGSEAIGLAPRAVEKCKNRSCGGSNILH